MDTETNLPAVPAQGTVAAVDMAADPYRAYLNRLGSEASRRVMAACLDRLAILAALLEPYSPGVELDPDGRQLAADRLAEATVHGEGAGQPWQNLRYGRTIQIRALITSDEFGWAPAYINKHLSALRGVLEEAWRQGLMSTDDYARAKDIKNVKGKRVMAGRAIHPDEMAAMLASAEAQDGPLKCRDSAMLMLLQSTGMRRDEITSARIEDYDARERRLLVTGKGNKQRQAWIHPAVVPYLDRWLARIDARTGPIFRAVDRWGNIKPGGISDDAVYLTVDRHRQRAGLPKLSPHDFRRTFVGELYDAGGDSQQARKLAGHEQSSTTDKYDRRGDRGLRDLVDSLPIVLPPTQEETK